MPEFRTELVLQNGKIGDRICGHIYQGAGHTFVVVVHTFNGEVVVAGTFTAEGRADSGSKSTGARSSGVKHGEIQYAQIQTRRGVHAKICGWQVFKHFAFISCLYLRRGCVERFGDSGHFDRRAGRTGGESDIGGAALIELHINIQCSGLETAGFRRDLIGTDW